MAHGESATYRQRMRRALLWMVLLAVAPGGLDAQSRLNGRLLEVFSGRALRCINVQLLDSTGTVLRSTETSPDGVVDTSSAFVLTATHAEFAVAVLRALPTLRFKPFVWTESTDCERITQAYHFTLRR